MFRRYHMDVGALTTGRNRTYPQAWRRYRALRNTFWALLMAFPPFVNALDRLESRFPRSGLSLICVFTWMIACWLTASYIDGWCCPRCGKTFASKSWRHKFLFAKECVHCGLRKFSSG